ncbi:MAG: hypothetical protein O9322_15700 [Beijerinckiaceae bacterium]|nr:hypothetical protein [Beijerinckiaceae bacterium]MCZ8300794.1 hypothetical protein [Beijerinckiaceae bacterium]
MTIKSTNTTRLGALAVILAVTAGAVSPAFARGESGGGNGGAGHGPMKAVNIQAISLPQSPPSPPAQVSLDATKKPCFTANSVMSTSEACGSATFNR